MRYTFKFNVANDGQEWLRTGQVRESLRQSGVDDKLIH